MKNKFRNVLFLIILLFSPTSVLAFSYNNSKLNILAVLNDTLDPNKLKYIIIGMIVIILILVGSILFGKDK